MEKINTSEVVSSCNIKSLVQEVCLNNMNLRSHGEQNHQQEKREMFGIDYDYGNCFMHGTNVFGKSAGKECTK